MKGTRIDSKLIIDEIEKREGEFISETIRNNVRYITIKCKIDGNVWENRLNNIMAGQWCKICYNRNRTKIIDDNTLSDFISDRGFKLLTDPPYTKWGKVKIYCPKHDHMWITSYGHLERGGSNCKFCGHGAASLQEIKEIAKANNAEFVRRIENVNSVMNILLRCKKHNHEWRTNVADIKKLDRWCTKCRREERKTSYNTIKKAIEARGGKLITDNCNGSLTRIDVECTNGHQWKTCFDYINQGYWCPECPYKTQTGLYDIIKKLFPGYTAHYNYRGFEWLRMNKKNKQRMEIDIWVPEIKLAIEYDGIQHSQPVKFSNNMTDEQAKKVFFEVKRRDKKKNNLISERPNIIEHFIRFDHMDEITEEVIIRKLVTNGIQIRC